MSLKKKIQFRTTFAVRTSLGNWKLLWSGSTVVSLKRSLSINQFIYHPNCPLYNISTDWSYGSDSCFIVEKLKGLKEKHKNVVTATINHYWRLSKYVTYVTSCHFCRHESQNQTFFGGNYSDRWPEKHWEQLVSSVLETFHISMHSAVLWVQTLQLYWQASVSHFHWHDISSLLLLQLDWIWHNLSPSVRRPADLPADWAFQVWLSVQINQV